MAPRPVITDSAQRDRRSGPTPTGSGPTIWCPRAVPRAAAGACVVSTPPSDWSTSASRLTRPGRPSSRPRSARAARAIQDRRDGQGRRRQDHRVRLYRVGFRRAAPGRPGRGHRRRHRVRQAGQPRRPEGAGSYWELASDQYLDTFADVRSRVGNNAAGLFVLAARRRRHAAASWIPRSTEKPHRGWTAISPSRSSTAARPWTPRSPRRYCAISTR